MFISFQRVVRSGWEKFVRDKSSSGAALFVMVIVLTIATMLFLLYGAASFTIAGLQESVDISTYVKDSATQEEVAQLKEDIESIPAPRHRVRHNTDRIVARHDHPKNRRKLSVNQRCSAFKRRVGGERGRFERGEFCRAICDLCLEMWRS